MKRNLTPSRRLLLLMPLCVIALFSCLREEPLTDRPISTEYEATESKNEPKLLTLKSGAVVEVSPSGEYLYQGDMVLSERQLLLLDETGAISDPVKNQLPVDYGLPVSPITGMSAYAPESELRALGRSPYLGMFWSMVRYTLHPSLSFSQKMMIDMAIRTIESQTNARFYNATGKPTRDPNLGIDYPYIEFVPNNSINSSSVGRVGGRQEIKLATFSESVIIHEICHALGMFHEQSRRDRDQYVTIHYTNILPNKAGNFQKENKNVYMLGEFDFLSIMLYDSYAFSVDPGNKPTMTRKDGSLIWSAHTLSENDRKFINTFYIPYVAREDVCIELDHVMYDRNNRRMSVKEILELQDRLNMSRCPQMVTPVEPNEPDEPWLWEGAH